MSIGKSRDTSLGTFITALASDQMAPGAGGAVGIVLALAAGCARKALAISHRHRPLQALGLTALDELAQMIEEGFESADRDDTCFTHFLRSHDPASAKQLLEADQKTQQLGERLQQLLLAIEVEVLPMAKGDLMSAGTLLRAAADIQAEIAGENARAARRVSGPAP